MVFQGGIGADQWIMFHRRGHSLQCSVMSCYGRYGRMCDGTRCRAHEFAMQCHVTTCEIESNAKIILSNHVVSSRVMSCCTAMPCINVFAFGSLQYWNETATGKWLLENTGHHKFIDK